MTAYGVELPPESIDGTLVRFGSEELIYKTSNNICAQRQPGGPVVLLLPLEPSTLEEGLVIEDVCRRPDLTEQPLRCIQRRVLPFAC